MTDLERKPSTLSSVKKGFTGLTAAHSAKNTVYFPLVRSARFYSGVRNS